MSKATITISELKTGELHVRTEGKELSKNVQEALVSALAGIIAASGDDDPEFIDHST